MCFFIVGLNLEIYIELYKKNIMSSRIIMEKAYTQKNKNLIMIKIQALNLNMICIYAKIPVVQKGYNIGFIFKFLLRILKRGPELNLILGIYIEIKVYLIVVCYLEFYMQIKNNLTIILEREIGILIQKLHIQLIFQLQINWIILILYI